MIDVVPLAIDTCRLNLGDHTVRYLAAGPVGRPACLGTIVFLHAFPLNAGMWRPQLEALPAGWAGIAPDFRGFGGTAPDEPPAPPRGDADLDDYVADVIGLVDHLAVRHAVFCGCSMGGYAAFALARRHPGRLAGLVLANTRATADSDRDRASRTAMLDVLASQGPAAIAEQMLPRLLGETSRAAGPDLAEEVRCLAAAATASGIGHAVVRMMNRADSTPLLASLAVPVLVVAGAEDALIPFAEAEAMREAIRTARLVVVPGAGHLPNIEQPGAFNSLLSGFLAEVVRHDAGPRVTCAGAVVHESGIEAGAPNRESRTPSPDQ